MSIPFSNEGTKRGLVQFYEREAGYNYGDVSRNPDLLAMFTARVNNAIDDYLMLWAKSAGTWQGDDYSTYETDGVTLRRYPIITANITAGVRDITFTDDGQGNRIKDVQKVLILPSSTATEYVEISPIDELNINASSILVNSNQGVPYQYGKLANGIFFDPLPSYSKTAGVKMIVNREGSYYRVTDTTKVPGVPVYHEYFYLKPALEEAGIRGLSNLTELKEKVIDLEGSERLRITGKIVEFFSSRERDVRKIMTPKKINFI